jgi:hypothetical protein
MNALLQPSVDADRALEALFRIGDCRMDTMERLFLAEKEALRLQGLLTKHEEICSHRYTAIENGMARMAANLKWLAVAVGCLILVEVGVASVKDIVRSGAGRIGVTVSPTPGDK